MAFDINAARKSGYSDQDIQDFLIKNHSDFNVNGALNAGYSLDDISSKLNASTPEPSLMDKAKTVMNTPAIPFKELGGKLLDYTSQLTGAGPDRSIIKQNLPTLYGGLESVAGKAEQLTTPTNVGLGLGMAAASPEIAAGAAGTFAVKSLMDLFKSYPQKLQEYKNALASGDKAKQSKIVTDAGLDIGMTGLAGNEFAKHLELPAMGDVTSSIKGVVNAPFVNQKANEVLSQMPSQIQTKTGVEPIGLTKAGQDIQSSFERGFGQQEAGFNQEHQNVVEQANKDYESTISKAKQEAQELKTSKEARFNQGVQDISNKYGNEPIGLQEAGQPIAQNFQGNLDKLKNTAGKLYEKIDEVSPHAPALPDGTNKPLDFIKNIFSQRNIESPNVNPVEAGRMEIWKKQLQKEYGLDAGQIKQVLDQTDSLAAQKFTSDTLDTHTLNAYKYMNNLAEKLQNPDLSVHDLSLINSEINRYAYSRINDPIRNVYKALGSIVKDQIANAAEAAGFGDLSNNARALWKNYKTLEDSNTAKVVGGTPENIIPKIAKANSPTAVQELMANIDPSTQNTFRRAILDNYMEKAGGDVGKMAKLLSSKTAETNKAIFGEDAPLIERYSNFGRLIDQMKPEVQNIPKPNIPESQPYSPTEMNVARLIRNKDAGNIVDSLIGNGSDETRIKAAINGMDEQGRQSLRNGIFQKVKDSPEVLNKIPDNVLKSVYGENAKLFTAYRDLLNSKNSDLKSSLLKDVAEIAIPGFPYFWYKRASAGFKGIANKVGFQSKINQAQSAFK